MKESLPFLSCGRAPLQLDGPLLPFLSKVASCRQEYELHGVEKAEPRGRLLPNLQSQESEDMWLGSKELSQLEADTRGKDLRYPNLSSEYGKRNINYEGYLIRSALMNDHHYLFRSGGKAPWFACQCPVCQGERPSNPQGHQINSWRVSKASLMDLSNKNFAKLFDEAFGYKLLPPFDPYRDSLSYMLGSYVIPYMGLIGYVGTNPNLIGHKSKMLWAGLLGVEGGQDAVTRMYLYERFNETVKPYKITVAEFTIRISELRNKLAMCGIKDEGIIVPLELGAENRTTSNVLSTNTDSLSYSRIPAEILTFLYDSGDESVPGGFYPRGGNGKIARGFLK
ncbi:ferritin-like catalase Nec2 [Cornus florida]|uniref:ferritin-like catalase Nec2 n=1 Tax=Cornus florida TaxID=4283 RepID=UPI00289701EF|nr:ferritin-like catalase Nec2 [Cornus florida]